MEKGQSDSVIEIVTLDYFLETIEDSLTSCGVDIDEIDFEDFQSNEPIQILVELSKSGKIDPWNIDIVEVTDSFLNKIEEMQMTDLRISGRTLLYSCILLRMKSLELMPEERDDFPDDDYIDEYDIDFDSDKIKMPAMPIRRFAKRPVTLNELIEELKKAEKTATKRKQKEKNTKQEIVYAEELTTEDVLNIAHEEVILKRTVTLLKILKKWFKTREYVTIEDVFSLPDGDRIMDYVTLLFLTAMHEIILVQDVVFSELRIYPPALDLEEVN